MTDPADQLAQRMLGFSLVGDRVMHRQNIGLWGAWGRVSLCAETPFQKIFRNDACPRFFRNPPCVSNLLQTSEPGDDVRFEEPPPRLVASRAGKARQNLR